MALLDKMYTEVWQSELTALEEAFEYQGLT
jgi:hypothetical protein